MTEASKEMAALNMIAAVAAYTLDLDELLDATLARVLKVLGFDSGAIYQKGTNSEDLQLNCYQGLSEAFGDRAGEDIISVKVGQNGEPIFIGDLREDSRSPEVFLGEGFRSQASVPLIYKSQPVGVLTVLNREVSQFAKPDIEILVSVGHQIGIAIENARLFRSEQRRAEQSKLIAEVGRQVTSILDLDELLTEMARLIRDAFDHYHVAFGLVEGNEVVYQAGAGVLWDDSDFDFSPKRLRIGHEGTTGWVAEKGEPVLVPDVSQDAHYVHMRGSATRSELTVPIMVRERVIGVLDIQSDRKNAFDESDLEIHQTLAHQAAVAIENANLFEAERRRAEHFRVISEVGRRVTSILTVGELLDQMAQLIQEAFHYDIVEIGLIEGDEVVFQAGAGKSWEQAFETFSLKVDTSSITGWVASTGEPLMVADVSQDPRYVEIRKTHSRSEIAVPIKSKDIVAGVINIQSEQKDAFDEIDLAVVQSLADQAAIGIENARLYQQAKELAVVEERSRLARDLHDAVTQTLFSASLIAEVLPRLWERDREEALNRLEELRQLTRGALAEMRTLLLELRPAALTDVDMEDLLHQLAAAVRSRAGISVSVETIGDKALPVDLKVSFYRIAQEALNNIAKHSNATRAEVTLISNSESAELTIRDDGSGFNVLSITPEHLGLNIMRERAETLGAELSIESEIDHGSVIAVKLDLEANDEKRG